MQNSDEKRPLPERGQEENKSRGEADARVQSETAANGDRPVPERQEKRNWITDIYDKMNVSVKTLDIMIVALCLLIVLLFVFGNRIKLGF